MSGEPEKKSPPYPSYTTFENFINGLRDTGVPGQIDSSLVKNLSGSAQSSLLGALRFLNLVGENKVPSDEFRLLVEASEKDRPALLREIIRGAYPFLETGVPDLNTATPAQLQEVFREMGASAGTLDKAITFFLAAAKGAGIVVSPHILKRKHVSGNGSRKPRSVTPKYGSGEVPTPPPKNPPTVPDAWLAKYPDFNPEWDEALQEKWLAGFEKLMALRQKVSDQQ